MESAENAGATHYRRAIRPLKLGAGVSSDSIVDDWGASAGGHAAGTPLQSPLGPREARAAAHYVK
jgi:hypothetical protein